MNFTPATQPTMYFIGVTTGKSSIMKVFPEWSDALGYGAVMKGIDIGIHAEAEKYREAVEFIKNDPLSLGALVTTHKLDLYAAAHDIFDEFGPYAKKFGEISSIYKRNGKLWGEAKDPITCGMAMEEFIPVDYWRKNPEAGVMIMGAGGSCISMCSYFMRPEFAGNQPKKIVVCNRSQPRLSECERINRQVLTAGPIETEYYLTPEPEMNDAVLAKMPKGSVIINATGLGKDRPGSPLSDGCQFPENAIVWEINYRGDLRFMHQAEEQQAARGLIIADGWMYFIYGWTQVISDVFNEEILGEKLFKLNKIAARHNNR